MASKSPSLSSQIFSVVGSAVFWITIGRVFGPSSTVRLNTNEPFSVDRRNYIVFSDVEVKRDNGKLLYYSRHICPLDITVNGNSYQVLLFSE